MGDIKLSNIIIPFLTGGVMGAILNQIFAAIKNRIQPVGYNVEILPLFKKNIEKSNVITNVTISEDNSQYTFENLFIINISVSNKGNKDFDKFKFAITLRDGDKIIALETENKDVFHNASLNDDISPGKPLGEVIVELEPFNRKNTYDFRLYVTIPEKNEEPGEIKFSSPSSVRFTQTPPLREVGVSVGKLSLEMFANQLGIVSTIKFKK